MAASRRLCYSGGMKKLALHICVECDYYKPTKPNLGDCHGVPPSVTVRYETVVQHRPEVKADDPVCVLFEKDSRKVNYGL